MAESEATQQRVVVIAEDEPHIRRILALRLSRRGYEVVEAYNGLGALKALEALASTDGRHIVAIVDVMMPGMDGLSLIRAMREDEALRHIPALVVSAVRDKATHAALRDVGVNVILAKPFSNEELMHAVDTAFGDDRPEVS